MSHSFDLRCGDYVVEVVSRGAALRSLRHRGRPLVSERPAEGSDPAMRGAILAPWPNRTADGKFFYAGVVHYLGVTELETMTAVHGLISECEFQLLRQTPHSLVLSAIIDRPVGYPWRIRLDVTYQLSKEGVRHEIVATNESTTVAPIGLGGHPYLMAGTGGHHALDNWILRLPADEVLTVSEDRFLPVEQIAVEGTCFDFTSCRRIGSSVLNNAFTSLKAGDDGHVVISLLSGRGGVELVLDHTAPWVQVYTADALAGAERRHALAVEPMTCPPDALNSHVDLRLLPPFESTALRWWVRAA